MKLPQKIPTFLGLILTVVIVVAVAFLLEQTLRIVSKASASIEPNNIQISNVTDSIFTVTWITQENTTGFLTISQNGRSLPTYDEQDTAQKLAPHKTHSVTYRNATSNTTYEVTLYSNGQSFPKNGPLKVHTAALITNPSPLGALDPAYGTIITAQNEPVQGALVYLTLENGQLLSSITGKSGTWLIPLNTTRTNNLESYLPSKDRMTETIQVFNVDGQSTAITDTLNDSPVPMMTIGKSYDFRKQQAHKQNTSLAQSLQLPAVLGTETTQLVQITSPSENAAIIYPRPRILGTGVAGKNIKLSIAPAPTLTDTTTVSKDGTWSYTPPRALGEGTHTITISSVDASGKLVTATRTFTILKSGTQVLGDATPSATLAPTSTNTPTPTPLLTDTPTISPTATPTATPTPTSTLSGQPVPVTGNGTTLLGSIIIMGGILLFIVGFAL